MIYGPKKPLLATCGVERCLTTLVKGYGETQRRTRLCSGPDKLPSPTTPFTISHIVGAF